MKTAVYAGTEKVYSPMLASLKSLLANSDVDKVYLVIEGKEFPYELPDCVEVVDVSGQTYFTEGGANYDCKWTHMAMIKTAFPRIFPTEDKMLWLDCDTIVQNDISELWDIPMDGYWFAGVKEPEKTRAFGYLYINAGVLMMNLKKLREDGIGDRLVELLNTRKYPFTEQDCICEQCHDGILELPADYNVTYFMAKPNVEKIVHYAALRNWQAMPLIVQWLRTPWEEVMKNRI